MRRLLLILCLFFCLNSGAQFSKTHYIPPLSGSEFVLSEEQYIYISTPSETAVPFRIIYLGGQQIEGTVSRSTPFVQSMGFVAGNNSQVLTPWSGAAQIRSDKGVIVEAEDMVYVSVRLIAGDGNQAGQLVSKGLASLGKEFRVGGMLNTLMEDYSQVHYTFASVLATENNTVVTFSDIKPGASLLNSGNGSNDFSVVLNSGQSYVIASQGPNQVNRDALIGMKIASDKPIAVNCGSFGGTNGELFNLDLGFDQIVPSERTGTDYIFIRSTGMDPVEKILLIANEDGTAVFLGGDTFPTYLMNAGDYVAIDGSLFGPNGNLFVHTSKNVFAYQSVGDDIRPDQANQELFFVPPLSCETPRIIDNIPLIEFVGNRQFTGRITLVTETESTLEFNINGQDHTLSGLASLGAVVTGPLNVTGNPGFETYTITGLTGNVAVSSTTQLYLASYGSSEAATFGGYYSGFTFRPEISQEILNASAENCLPNLELSVHELTGFDTFQWFFNDVAIPGATQASYLPTQPGYYHVRAAISSCSTELESERLPVSLCAPDSDQDGVNDNLDLDLDNDGLTNCLESLGDLNFNMATSSGGTISSGTYNNTFTLGFPTGSGPAPVSIYSGFTNGNFTTRTSAGTGNSTVMQVSFGQPMAFSLGYPAEDLGTDNFNDAAEYRISVPTDQTISVFDPNHQLLIDTNCDGVFENGVTSHSSFEIRFRLNSGTPILPGAGTFQIRAHAAASVKITHINLSDDFANASSLKLIATCLPRDSDADGVPDSLDFDSDNDGIADIFEIQGPGFQPALGTDSNQDGHDDAFSAIVSAVDSDGDGIPDFLDLDADNNGVFDTLEGGTGALDTNFDGRVDGTFFGVNGFLDELETQPDSGQPIGEPADTDADGIWDYVSPDNDGDGCRDVIEAGFDDDDADGFLGSNAPAVTNANGQVQWSSGYVAPLPDLWIAAPISILSQPASTAPVCEGEAAQFSISTDPAVTVLWETNAGGAGFVPANDPGIFSGWNTSELTVLSSDPAMNGQQFRAILSRNGNACGLISDTVTLNVQSPPAVVASHLIQCEPGPAADGLALFNLAQADASFSPSGASYSVAYFLSQADAEAGTSALNIHYQNVQNPELLFVRVSDPVSGCSSISTLELSVTSVPLQQLTPIRVCEDQQAEDGFAFFDLPEAVTGVDPSELTFYNSLEDALLENNTIAGSSNYQNLQSYQTETIYARQEAGNSCSQLYAFDIQLLPLPPVEIRSAGPYIVCQDDPSVTVNLDIGPTDSSSVSSYQFQWLLNGDVLDGAFQSNLTVSLAGNYQAIVTGSNGCQKILDFVVSESGSAIVERIEINDLSQHNTVRVLLDAASLGDYEFSLDEPNFFQQSALFENVPPGIHTVYVKDRNGCATIWVEIQVLGVTPFFTPNADGYNDFWMLKGSSANHQAQATVFIYDRYGKLLKQLAGFSEGWDGTFNGNPLPADDYWYRVILEDGRSATGHFALKR